MITHAQLACCYEHLRDRLAGLDCTDYQRKIMVDAVKAVVSALDDVIHVENQTGLSVPYIDTNDAIGPGDDERI